MIVCKSCNAEIPPAFVHTIQLGTCPGCGSALFSDADKELLDELTTAMERMPNNPQGIAGWLMSNYHFTKIGDAVPTEKFHVKGQQKQPDSPTNKFLERTNAFKNIAATQSKTNSKLAAMAEAISTGNIDEEMYGSGSSEIKAPANAVETDEELIEMESVPVKYQAEALDRPSRALMTDAQLVDPKIQLSEDELNAAYLLAGGMDTGDVVSENPIVNKELHQQRMKRVLSQQNFESGGGFIRRAGG